MAKTSCKRSTAKRRVPEKREYRSGDSLTIRWLLQMDMPDVVRMDRLLFGLDSWVEDDFTVLLKSHLCVGLVATSHDYVVGYIIYEWSKNRVDLLRLCVLPEVQRQTIGTQMIACLKHKLVASQKCKHLVADVPDDQLAMQLFLKEQGFIASSIQNDEGKEVYRMVYTL